MSGALMGDGKRGRGTVGKSSCLSPLKERVVRVETVISVPAIISYITLFVKY